MNLSVGIIGLPNVGKSTLFNALLKKQSSFAEASAGQAGLGGAARVGNFPFTTIEPNVGIVPVSDSRLEKLAEITKEEEKMSELPPIKPATVNFVDIAGLVKGASEGAGLGNKFLSHIREVSIIAHVVRAFEDPSASSGQAPIIREGSVDPKTDYETIEMELVLADLQTIQQVQSKVKRFQKETEKTAIDKLFKGLNEGKPARETVLSDEEQKLSKTFFLLSSKPEIIVLNVSETDYNTEGIEKTLVSLSNQLDKNKDECIVVSAKIEAELAELSEEDQRQYLSDLGVKESGLERLIKKAYKTLGLISFLTAGEKEVRAWTLRAGSTALRASGEIHSDFMNKFIKAEVVAYDDFVGLGGRKAAREKGKARLEGRDYIMQDGDVVEFKIGA